MADDFEARFYALLDNKFVGDETLVNFKAKGDAAWIFADLEQAADVCDFDIILHRIMELMRDYGLPPPEPRVRQIWLGHVSECLEPRDLTVGELKQAVKDKAWPKDAWTCRAMSFEAPWLRVFETLTLWGAVAGIVLSMLAWLAHWKTIQDEAGFAFIGFAMLRFVTWIAWPIGDWAANRYVKSADRVLTSPVR